MPARRNSAEVINLNGSRKKNPKRYQDRQNEPGVVGEIGPPPEHLLPDVKKVWNELVDNAAPGVLGSSDRIALEVLANLVAEYRAAPGAFTASMITQMRALLNDFGMTAAGRSKVSTGKGEKVDDSNPFEAFRKAPSGRRPKG